MSKLEDTRRLISSHVAPPLARLLARTHVTPNALTWMGFVITAGAAALIITGHNLAAGIVALLAGFIDTLDGALARLTGRVTRFGAVLDSTLDRLSEAVLLLAVLVVFAREEQVAWSLLTGVALVGSLMVSYIRARIEGLGVACQAGFFTRPERVIILALGLLLSRFNYALVAAVGLLAFLSFFTVIERLVYAWRQLKD
ncbi:MAG: CDP-alcohol phosphatidyltransferase family protein [Kiritimatiellota bacterium]|nr:CDP-alcohol phosphatidyltransferase family protein [Kiritimatiellota bacterium]